MLRQPGALAHAHAEAIQLPMSLAEPPPRTSGSRRRCAFLDGFSLHADTSVDAGDRPSLERLVRYLLRPLISADRLTVRPDGRVHYQFRRPDPSGRTSWVTDDSSWCRRLATLIPPRRSHTTRFRGVLSSAHRWRSGVVPSIGLLCYAGVSAKRSPSVRSAEITCACSPSSPTYKSPHASSTTSA